MQSQAGTAESPIQVVESFLRALEEKDLDRAAAHLADDVVYQNVPLPADHGKPAVLRTLKAFQKFVTDFEVRMKKHRREGRAFSPSASTC